MITQNRQTVCFILLTAVMLLSTIGFPGAAQDNTLTPAAGPIAPTVVRVVPERGEELRVDAAIVLSFSTEMDRTATEGAVHLSPEVPLRLEWPNERALVVTVRVYSTSRDHSVAGRMRSARSLGHSSRSGTSGDK